MLGNVYDFIDSLWKSIVPEGKLRLPTDIYRFLALTMRYWFLALMVIIVIRCYRWYRLERRNLKKSMQLLPDAGYIGELVVITGNDKLPAGTAISIPREGTLGVSRVNDIVVSDPNVSARHLWFRFDEERGLSVHPLSKNAANVDGKMITGSKQTAMMIHGSRLYVGSLELRLRLFAGFDGKLYRMPPEYAMQPYISMPVFDSFIPADEMPQVSDEQPDDASIDDAVSIVEADNPPADPNADVFVSPIEAYDDTAYRRPSAPAAVPSSKKPDSEFRLDSQSDPFVWDDDADLQPKGGTRR